MTALRHPFGKLAATVVACVAACALGFVIGERSPSPARARSTPTPTPPAATVESVQATLAAPAPDSSAYSDALSELFAADALDSSFYAHYRTARLARSCDTQTLIALLRDSAQLKGPERAVLRLILALELGKRDLSAALAALRNPTILRSGFDYSLFQRYWTLGNPENPIQGNFNAYQLTQDQQALDRLADAIDGKLWNADPSGFAERFRAAYANDPQAGIEAARALSDPVARFRAAEGLASAKWPSAMAGLSAIDAFLDEGEPVLSGVKARCLAQVMTQIRDESEAQAALQWLDANLNAPPVTTVALLQSLRNQRFPYPQLVIDSNLFKAAPPSPIKQQLRAQAILLLAGTDLDAALDQTQSTTLTTSSREQLLTQLVQRPARKGNVDSINQILDRLDSPARKLDAIRNVGQNWRRDDPAGYAEWAISVSDPKLALSALACMPESMIQANPDMVATLAAEMAPSPERFQLESRVATAIGQTDVARALEFASRIEDPDIAIQAAMETLTRQSSLSPRETVEVAVTAYGQSPQALSSISQLASNWAQMDVKACAQYFSRQTNPKLYQAGLGVALGQWIQMDQRAALNFARQLPASDATDQLLSEMATGWQAQRQPAEVTASIVALISDPEIRDRAIERIAQFGNTHGDFIW